LSDPGDLYVLDSVTSADDQVRRGAQRTVCAHALDREDAEDLLKMLGLHPGDDGTAHCRRCGQLMSRRGRRLVPGADGMCHLCTYAQQQAAGRVPR
jgi:hypothetical protein